MARLASFHARLEEEFGAGPTPVFLKYPLSALLLPEICREFAPQLVYVLRPLAEIEATRQRRGWSEQFGARGAGLLYPRMFEALVELPYPTHLLRYAELLADPAAQAGRLARFCGLDSDAAAIERAAAVVRPAPR